MIAPETLYERFQQAPFIFAGPCVIESETLVMQIAETAKTICEAHNIPYVFKASFDKANRTSLSSFRGPGLDEGLRILEKSKTPLTSPSSPTSTNRIKPNRWLK